jgi:hypothetical protein
MTPQHITPDDQRRVIDALLRAADSLRIARNRYRRAFIGASIVSGILATMLWSTAGAQLLTGRTGEIEIGAAWLLVALALGIIALASDRITRRMK